jgi:hypothetical protein
VYRKNVPDALMTEQFSCDPNISVEQLVELLRTEQGHRAFSLKESHGISGTDVPIWDSVRGYHLDEHKPFWSEINARRRGVGQPSERVGGYTVVAEF